MQKKTLVSIVAIFVALCGGAALAFPYLKYFSFTPDPSLRPQVALLEGSCEGTPSRVEREHKLGITNVNGPLNAKYAVDKAYAALSKHLQDSRWRAPNVFGASYRINREPMVFAARDFYFDTADGDLASKAASYRLRYRFRSLGQVLEHERNQLESAHFPYRVEVQAKTNRKELGEGKSEVYEARFEWRKQSEPFNDDYLPPLSPWLPQEFIGYAQTGMFGPHRMVPTCELLKAIPSLSDQETTAFIPRAVVVTSRHRMHLNIDTPYGSGPNPDQAYILSVDYAQVYDGAEYVASLNWLSGRKRPQAVGDFLELEVEFERNVSTRIDVAVVAGEEPLAPKALEAFLADQATIIAIVKEALAHEGYALSPKSGSKFEEAARLGKNF